MPRAGEQLYSVLVAAGSEAAGARLSAILPENRFRPVRRVGSGNEARRLLIDMPFDLVLLNAPLPDTFGPELAREIAADPRRGVLLLVPADAFDSACDAVEDAGVLTLAKPTAPQAVYQAMRLLVATRARLSAMEKKAETLSAKMEEIRVVNRAKWILIAQFQMDEAAAHRYIEKQAMDTHRTRREVAQGILMAYEP